MGVYVMRVMTLNIWNYNEPWLERRELIAALIRQYAPEVIGFQEIRLHKDRDVKNQAEQLAELLPEYKHRVWQPAQVSSEDRWEGLAVFSQAPITHSDHLPLTRDESDPRDAPHQRIVLHADIEWENGKKLAFYVTHLSLSATARERSVRELEQFVQETRGSSPAVVVGDFNAEPHTPPMRYLLEKAAFADAWTALYPDELGYTFASYKTQRRIDYILTTAEVEVNECLVVGDKPNVAGHWPSDHCGVVADLVF